MASLNSGFKVGNASTTNLLKSANTLAREQANYQDQIQALDYANSAYTDEAFARYQSYLQGRINQLNGAGNVADASKALTMQKTLEGAMKSNVSSTIQRENIQVLAGNATKQDKYNIITQQYVRAVNNGDLTLAQSLESQAYSLSQSIQYDQQQAAASAQTLAKAAASKATSEQSFQQKTVAEDLKAALTKFNTDYAHAGQKSSAKAEQDFVKSITPQLDALGIHLADGVKPNYFDIVSGVNQAIFKAYTNEAQIYYAAGDTSSYMTAIKNANDVVGKVSTIYGDMNAAQVEKAASNPNQFGYNAAPDFVGQKGGGIGGQQNPQVGYQINPQTMNVEPTISQTPWINVPQNLSNRLKQLGLQVVGDKLEGGNAYTVHATNQSPQWLKNLLASNATTKVVANQNGNIQFESDAQHGQGMAVYTIAKNGQVYESSNEGDRLLFDPTGGSKTPEPHTSFLGKVGSGALSMLKAGATPLASLFSGHASAQDLINSGQMTQFQIAQANAKAAAALLALKPPTLPHINIAPPPPSPSISQPPKQAPASMPTMPSYPVQKATSVQSTAPVPGANPSGKQLQGGSFNLQGGGGGIPL